MEEGKIITPQGQAERPKIPLELPVMPSRDLVLFPKMVIPFMVTDPNLIKLVDDALNKDKIIAIVTMKKGEEEKPPPDNLYQVGCAAQILKMAKVPDVGVKLLVQGLARIRIMGYVQKEPYLTANVSPHYEEYPPEQKKDVELEALMTNVRGLFQKVVELSPYLPPDLGVMAMNVEEPGILADMVASTLNI